MDPWIPPGITPALTLAPPRGGYEVATELKSDLATKHIPIMMITALHDRATKLRALSAGADDFLTKPLDRTELCLHVRQLLRLETSAD